MIFMIVFHTHISLLWHVFHKYSFEILVKVHCTIYIDLSAAHSCCESSLLPHPKSVILHSDSVTGLPSVCLSRNQDSSDHATFFFCSLSVNANQSVFLTLTSHQQGISVHKIKLLLLGCLSFCTIVSKFYKLLCVTSRKMSS